MVTWRSLLDELTARLTEAGVEDPGLDARRMVEAASGHDGPSLHEVTDLDAGRRAVAALDRMQERRLRGEPLQYVVGSWGFRTLDLFVDRRVLIPRPETETVAGVALEAVDRAEAAAPVVVDLGTGSGAIALAVAVERPASRVWGTDVSGDALDVARANLAGIGRAGRRVELREGSWYEALPEDLVGEIDVVVSNPPYVGAHEDLPPVVADWEPHGALVAGPDGLEAVEVVLTGAADWLRPGGIVVVELAPHQAERARGRAADVGLAESTVHHDLAGRARAVSARRP